MEVSPPSAHMDDVMAVDEPPMGTVLAAGAQRDDLTGKRLEGVGGSRVWLRVR